MPKKILYVIGYPHRMAGSQKQIEQLILNLPIKYKKAIFVTLEGGVSDNFKTKNIETHIIEPANSLNLYGKRLLNKNLIQTLFIFFRDYLNYAIVLRKFLVKEKYDLIHCNDARAVLLMGLPSLFTKAILITHIQGERPMKRNLLWSIFETLPKRIIANADFVKGTLSEKVWPKTKVVYTGLKKIDDYEKHQSKWLKNQAKNRVIISCFASIVPFKGYHHLVEAIRLLVKENIGQDFLFLFIGDIIEEYNFYFDFLLDKIEEDGIGEEIIFLGWQNNPYSYYDISHIAVLPSFKEEKLVIKGKELIISGNEGFPTIHLEAMQFGLPIIGTRIAGVPEQIENGINGILVEPSNPVQLKEALKELICSNEKRDIYGINSLKISRTEFSLDTYVSSVCNIYEDILNA